MLTDMSVPCRSPVTPTSPKHRLPILLLANSFDMWKVIETQSKTKSQLHLPNCQNFYEDSSKFELDSVKTQLLCETSSRFERGNVKNKAVLHDVLQFWTRQPPKKGMLRDFLNFRSWQQQKRNNSARLPSNIECWVQSWRPRTNAFCDFSTPPV
jgi:hypothetical protein